MWQDDKLFIIDWEASGFINPTIELIQVAWYWSGGDIESIDYNKFEKVINSYKQNYKGSINKNVDILINADVYGGLAWIDYNLKRSLCIESEYEQDEIKLAENEYLQLLAKDALAYILNYRENADFGLDDNGQKNLFYIELPDMDLSGEDLSHLRIIYSKNFR